VECDSCLRRVVSEGSRFLGAGLEKENFSGLIEIVGVEKE
jgi:hypothetical protein